MNANLRIRKASLADVDTIFQFIKGLAAYEKLADEATLTVDDLARTLFGERPYAEVLIADWEDKPAGFALYFYNYSTFLGRPGIYLEDLFVIPEKRGIGIGTALLKRLAQICVENNYGRLEWSVLDWNKSAIAVYDRAGATALNEWITYRLSGDSLDEFASAT